MRACAAAATSALHCMPATERAAADRWDHVRLLLAWTIEHRSGAPTIHTAVWFLGLVCSPQKPKSFIDSPSHRIFWHMYKALNIDENKN